MVAALGREQKQKQLRFLFCLRGDRRRASSRVRGYWISEELERLGHQCTILEPTGRGDSLRYLRQLVSHDVVIFQKRAGRRDPLLVQAARSARLRTLYDIDDLPRPNASDQTQRMLGLVDGVLAGSADLADFASKFNPNVKLLPSGIRLDNYPLAPDHPGHVPCIGWIGNGADYADDLVALLRPPLVAVAQQRPIKLKLVGACGVAKLHQAFSDIPGLSVEFVDQIDWGNPETVAEHLSAFDIGVYPLLDTEFNRYKCGFKALEYMASGLPVVASPVGTLTDLVTEDVGFASAGRDGWVRALDRLVGDPGLRRTMGRSGRRLVERSFSTKALARSVVALCSPREKVA